MTTDTTYLCSNSPCEAEAVSKYVTDKAVEFFLCFTCAEAFELGQVNPLKSLYDVDEHLSDEERKFEAGYGRS